MKNENIEVNDNFHWLHTPYKNKTGFTPAKALLKYSAYLIIPGIVTGLLYKITLELGSNINMSNLAMISIIVAYTALLLLYKPIFKTSPFEGFKTMNKEAIILAIKAYAIMLIGNVFITLIPSQVPENQQVLEQSLNLGSPILFGIFTVILAPLVEELLFRQVFFRSFTSSKSKTGVWIFTLNILVFTLMHTGGEIFSNLGGTLQYAWLSFIFAYTYAKTRSLSAPIALHILNNGIAFLAILLSQYIL